MIRSVMRFFSTHVLGSKIRSTPPFLHLWIKFIEEGRGACGGSNGVHGVGGLPPPLQPPRWIGPKGDEMNFDFYYLFVLVNSSWV